MIGLRRPLLGALLLASGGALAAGCQQFDAGHGAVDLPGCRLDGDRVVLESSTLGALEYDADGLAVVLAGDGYQLVTRQGRSLPVPAYDNGPDALQEGRVRGRVGKRIGFFDARLQPAFATTFDFAWPYQDGRARACNGCRPGRPDASGDGHVPMVGGEWFWIDRQGRRLPD